MGTAGIIHRKSFWSTVVDQAHVRLVRRLVHRRRALGAPRMFLAPDDYIGETILAEGWFEKGYLGAMGALFDIARTEGGMDVAGGVAIDVGANVGNHSLFFAQHVRRVHSFEPNPMVARVLEANVLLNPSLGERIAVRRVALSNADETLPFTQHFSNLGGSGFSRDGVGEDASATRMPLVHSGRAVAALLGPDDRVVCVKVDVEGLEDKVIEGLQDLLRTHRPLLFTEVTDDALGRRIAELVRACGYDGLYEVHNRLQFGEPGLSRRLWRAARDQVTYSLLPIEDYGRRIYPLVVAAPQAVIDAALRRA